MMDIEAYQLYSYGAAVFWLGSVILKLMISFAAVRKFPGRASKLMMMGSIGNAIVFVLKPILVLIMEPLGFSVESFYLQTVIADILSIIFAFLFLIGLYQLIKTLMPEKADTLKHLVEE